jgi:hypothetical protein
VQLLPLTKHEVRTPEPCSMERFAMKLDGPTRCGLQTEFGLMECGYAVNKIKSVTLVQNFFDWQTLGIFGF